MSSKKSLGSSPIGFSGLSQNSYRFIRDLGISKKNSQKDGSGAAGKVTNLKPLQHRAEKRSKADPPATVRKRSEHEPTEKKIVSYYLEIDLINQLKELADNRGEYYSSVVSKALQSWIDLHDI